MQSKYLGQLDEKYHFTKHVLIKIIIWTIFVNDKLANYVW